VNLPVLAEESGENGEEFVGENVIEAAGAKIFAEQLASISDVKTQPTVRPDNSNLKGMSLHEAFIARMDRVIENVVGVRALHFDRQNPNADGQKAPPVEMLPEVRVFADVMAEQGPESRIYASLAILAGMVSLEEKGKLVYEREVIPTAEEKASGAFAWQHENGEIAEGRFAWVDKNWQEVGKEVPGGNFTWTSPKGELHIMKIDSKTRDFVLINQEGEFVDGKIVWTDANGKIAENERVIINADGEFVRGEWVRKPALYDKVSAGIEGGLKQVAAKPELQSKLEWLIENKTLPLIDKLTEESMSLGGVLKHFSDNEEFKDIENLHGKLSAFAKVSYLATVNEWAAQNGLPQLDLNKHLPEEFTVTMEVGGKVPADQLQIAREAVATISRENQTPVDNSAISNPEQSQKVLAESNSR